MLATCVLAKPAARPALATRRTVNGQQRWCVVVRADNRPLREFREDTGEVTSSGTAPEAGQPAEPPKYLYADENPPPPRDTMSPEMKARLRQEYYGLGGSPNKAMGGNYFLNIILIVSLLAVLSKLFGYI